MHNENIVKEWLVKAEEDFAFASSSLVFDNFYAQICFHFQQAAEKYLKAFVIANGLEFRLVHNLLELLETCKERAPGICEIEEECRYLNAFYIDTRYPVQWPAQYEKNDAIRARESADKIRNWIRAALNA